MHFEVRQCLVAMSMAMWIPISGCDTTPATRSHSLYASDDPRLVRDLSDDEYARKVVAAQTEIESGRAPGACTQLLLAEGKDLYVSESVSSEDSKLLDAVCSLDDMQIAHFLQESHNSKNSSNQGLSLLADTLSKNGKIKGDLRYNSSKANEYSSDFAKSDALLVRRIYCADRAAESYRASASESFKSIMSPITLEKYNACVRAKSYGLYCDAAVDKDLVMLTVRWEPNELVRDILPIVALDWAAASSFVSDNPLPRTVGIGSGYAVSFKPKDVKAPATVIGLTGHDRGRNFNFSCRIDLQAKPEWNPFRKSRRPECGVEVAKVGEGPECGVKSYKKQRSAVCGIESYKASRSRACGVESYNSRHDCGVCGQASMFGGCKKCSSPSFGVEKYKECSDISHGVNQYAECEHPSHGAATYNSCRHETFGVELYRECDENP